mgnify:CR=1
MTLTPLQWRPYAARTASRDRFVCEYCPAIKKAKAPAIRWERQFVESENRTYRRCPACSERALAHRSAP